LDVLRLLLEVAQRDEEREIGVLGAGFLDRVVERALHQLPDAPTPRADHHAAADVVELGDLGVANDVLEPLRKVLSTGGGDPGFGLAFHILAWCPVDAAVNLFASAGGARASAASSGWTVPARHPARP